MRYGCPTCQICFADNKFIEIIHCNVFIQLLLISLFALIIAFIITKFKLYDKFDENELVEKR